MVASAKSFAISLYEEHLEEASVLYEQIGTYRNDPEFGWTDLADWEQRFERHIGALVVGGGLAIEVCRRRLVEGDVGELHAALRVLCRQRRKDVVYAALREWAPDDQEAEAALTGALQAECPAEWHEDLASVAARHPALAPILAGLAGYRRLKWETPLLQALPSASERGAAAVLWALGRVGGASSVAVTDQYARSDAPIVASAACYAAVRLGHRQTVDYAAVAAASRHWLVTALASAGDDRAVNALADIARSGNATDEVLIGLGLLGDLKAVRSIFDCLAVPDRASAAASALQLITGAELVEEVFLPDEVDPDELFDEERERYQATGEAPKRADGQPFGSTTVQIVTDQAVWKEWLSQNKARFDPSARYRYGELYSPRALLKSLLAERVPNRIRGTVCDEFRVRYGIDFPMEVDMPVIEQNRLLARLGEWVQANDAKFKPGEWYFHGRAMT